jgi:DNA-binding GntR family transcriptional regulator
MEAVHQIAQGFADVAECLANITTFLASGIAVYLFIRKRNEIGEAINVLLNYSLQSTLSELREKIERLVERDADNPDDRQNIKNIFHEIIGQLNANPKLIEKLPNNLFARMKTFSNNLGAMTEPKKRSLQSELRGALRNIHISSLHDFLEFKP